MLPSKLIRKKAQNHWPKILETLGINAAYLKNVHGACPVCGGHDRWRFDNKEGHGTFYCNKCGAGDGFKLLQIYHNWSFPYTLKIVSNLLGITEHYSVKLDNGNLHLGESNNLFQSKLLTEEEKNKRRYRLLITWQGSRLITFDDPVDKYLKTRGIKLKTFPTSLRYHPCLPYYEDQKLIGKLPAMLAIVKDKYNQPITIHRTYLGDGCKADVIEPKKLMPPIVSKATNGAAIKLYEPINGSLALSEGIENALSYYFAMQEFPSWATISAGGMEKVLLPTSVNEVTILVDNDERGRQAALTLSHRLSTEGRSVKRVIPLKIGQDLNDILLEGDL
jgi:putative DNA primase/helicase